MVWTAPDPGLIYRLSTTRGLGKRLNHHKVTKALASNTSNCSLFIPGSPWRRSKVCAYVQNCANVEQWIIIYIGIYSMNLYTFWY